MTKTIRIAAAQTKSLLTVQDTLRSLESLARNACQQGVGLLLFPEAYLGGYPRTCTFGSAIGSRDEHGREQYQAYFESSVDLGDTPEGAGKAWHQRQLPVPKGAGQRGDGTREELERIAQATGVFLAVGIIEKAGSSLYCGLVFVSPEDGMLLEKRRKVMPTGTERLVWSQGSTSTLRAFTTTIQGINVTIGTAICWENYMPLLRYSLYAQNVNIYLAPTADGRETWLPLLQTIATEGRTFVLSCNQVVRQSELPSWVTGKTIEQQTSVHGRQHSQSSSTSINLSRFRSSISQTQEGHEICWPGPENNIENHVRKDEDDLTSSPKSKRIDDNLPTSTTRRKSSIVGTKEGHEICFPTSQTTSDDKFSIQRPLSQLPMESMATSGENSATSGEHDDPFVSRGGSCVVSPFGYIVKAPLWQQEGLVVADVDVDECVKGKYDFDVAGHYSRSDAFKLTVSGLELNPP